MASELEPKRCIIYDTRRSPHCTVAALRVPNRSDISSCVGFVLLGSHDQFLLLVQSVCYTSSYLVFFLLRFSCHWACKAQAMSLFGLHFESRTLKSSSNRIQLVVNCNPSASGIWKVYLSNEAFRCYT